MPPEELIDVGGYRLALYCSGSDGLSIVLDAGGGADASSWEAVRAGVVPWARVCAFDRPGIGRSDPAPQQRSALQIVAEVHTLLARAAVPAPYVLVGHSSGGLNMRMFALLYRDVTAGLVLVDAVHPDQFRRAAALLPLELADEDAALREFRADLRTINQAQAARQAAADERPLELGRAGSLGALPLIVLTATEHDLGLPAAVTAPLEQDWQTMQKDMVALSSNAVQIVAEGSGHNIQLERPELVVEAIRRVVAAARGHTALRSGL